MHQKTKLISWHKTQHKSRWVAKIMAYFGTCTHSYWDSPSWGNRPVLEWHIYYKSLIEEIDNIRISTTRWYRFSWRCLPALQYSSLALIPGSCVSRERGILVHTVCIRTVLGFLGVCKISFVTLLKFVSHLILPNKNPVIYILVKASSLVGQMLTVSWAPRQVSWGQNALQHSTLQDKIQYEKTGF